MKYKSSYYEKEITQKNHIIEILLERQANKKGTELPLRYCDYKKWLNEFKRQLKTLQILLRDVTAESIILALKTEYKWVYSLSNPKFKKNIKSFYKKHKTEIPTVQLSPSGKLTKNSIGDFSINKKQTNLDLLDG